MQARLESGKIKIVPTLQGRKLNKNPTLGKVQDYVHAGKLIWLNDDGYLLNEEAYENEMKAKDIYNKSQIRTNPAQYLRHLNIIQ